MGRIFKTGRALTKEEIKELFKGKKLEVVEMGLNESDELTIKPIQTKK